MNAEHILQKANKLNHFSIIKMLISEGLLNYNTTKHIFITAVNYGNLVLLKFFIDSGKVDLGVEDNLAIKYSSLSGYTDIVKLLLESDKVDPRDLDNYAERIANKKGHTEIVELLKNWSKKWNSNYRQKNL